MRSARSSLPGRPSDLLLAVCVCGVVTCTVPTSRAQESEPSKTSWRGEAGVGFEYDTNVSVDEVDLSSGESDYAWIADFELGVKHSFTDRIDASLSYDVSQSKYQEFSRVDRLTQIVGGDLNAQLTNSQVGISAYYIDSRLDGSEFLSYTRLSPYVSGFLSRRWFARGAYVVSERDIADQNDRDALTNTGEVDFYYFRRGLRSYLNFGFRYRHENAEAPEFDFVGQAFKIRYIQRWDVFNRKAKSEFSVRYENRDYRSPEPTIGEKRKDRRVRWKVDLELPLTRRMAWQVYYSYGDYESNLPRADFNQTIAGTRLQYSW